MTLEAIAETYRTPIHTDECGDPLIRGKRGMLYVDGAQICIMLLDEKPVSTPKLKALGGSIWQGGVSPNKYGRRVQDAKVVGIDPDKVRDALRIIGAIPKRVLSPERREQLAQHMRSLSNSRQTTVRTASQSGKSSAGGGVVPDSHPGRGDAK